MGCTADDEVVCVGAGGAGEAEVVSPLGVDSGSAGSDDAAVSSAAACAAAGGCSTSMIILFRA